MKINQDSLIRRALKDERGQVLPWIAFMMVLFLGMGAFVLDIGHAFFCFRELQAATDAAALAGAQQLKTANPIATATAYSAVSGGKNVYGNMTNVSMVPGYPKLECLTTVTALGDACTAPNNANAIQVKEQAIIPTFFAQVLGINQMTLSATATAALSGAKATPLNLAIILDTTASMTTVDSNCNGGQERVVCAEQGVQTLLSVLYPCDPAKGCGTVANGLSQYPEDTVAIFTFPNVTVGTVGNAYDCSSSNPTVPVYSFPTAGGSSYAPSGSTTATYQITPFLSDYRSSDFTSDMTTSSDLVLAMGAGKNSSGTSCPGMGAPGGDGTYYAGSIYAAQAALSAQLATQLAANPNITPQNEIIFLSDGEANAASSKMATKTVSGTTINYNNPWPSGGGATSSVTNYPSALDQCQQAVAAANYAKSQGTLFYSIAYGSESSGCTTDSSGPQSNITPCQVMSEMASPNVYDSSGNLKTAYFYSDYNQSGTSSTCTSPGVSVSAMADIFNAIADQFLLARLIPDGTT